jgi:hypothetical protein
VAGLTNGVTYACTVRAQNAIGAGPESTAAIVQVGAPTAPPNVGNGAGPSPGSITVLWNPAATPPGAPLTGHRVTCKLDTGDGSTTTVDVGGAARSASVTGLAPTSPYVCEVAASNQFGTGLPRRAAAATTPR